jgi:phenylacetate-CoA ligase
MRDSLLKIYHRLPSPVRSVVASAHGYCLYRWRYGRETEQLVLVAKERENWTRDQWDAWTKDHLTLLLERAATKVPFYRDYWKSRRLSGDMASWLDLSNWPILEKESLRLNPEMFVADDCNLRKMYHEHTSGTSGKPIDVWWTRSKLKAWYALWEARIRSWYGVTRFDRWAILGGQLVVPVHQNKPPYWVWNAGMHQLYMSSYHLSPSSIADYVEAIRKYRIVYLWGYTSSLYTIAQEMLRNGIRPPKLKVVFTNAEPIDAHQRSVIKQAFDCPVCETYGMCEAVAAATECHAGRLHLWPSAGFVEVINGAEPVPDGTFGDLVCTGLINTDFVLIRYRVGDRGALSPDKSVCDCGRNLPTLLGVEGRSDDILYTTDGRKIGRLDPVFKSNLPIREVQIVQESLETIRVLYVPTEEFSKSDGQAIIRRLQDRMGPINVVLEAMEKIPRSSNGKFRAVVCRLPQDVRQQFDQQFSTVADKVI